MHAFNSWSANVGLSPFVSVTFAKIIAAVVLLSIWSVVGWIVAHKRGISRELVKDEAMPQPGPRTNFLLLVGVVLTGFSGLLLYVIFS